MRSWPVRWSSRRRSAPAHRGEQAPAAGSATVVLVSSASSDPWVRSDDEVPEVSHSRPAHVDWRSKGSIPPTGSSSSRSSLGRARRPCRFLRERWERPSEPTIIGFERDPHGVGQSSLAVIVVLLTVDLLLHRGNHEPTAKRALDRVGGVGGVRARVRRRGARVVGRPRVRRVPERLRHREVAQHRQRLRVGGDLLDASPSQPATSTGCCSGASSARW